jgi:hypothetical protein
MWDEPLQSRAYKCQRQHYRRVKIAGGKVRLGIEDHAEKGTGRQPNEKGRHPKVSA